MYSGTPNYLVQVNFSGTIPMQRRQFLSFSPKFAAATFFPAYISNAWAQDGIGAKTITIGCTAALTGPLGGFGKDLQIGVQAAMARINAKGGIHGRQLQFAIQDDAYVPARSAENITKMLSDNSVFAIMSCIGTPNNAAIMPLIEDADIPYVAPLTGASSLRKPGMRNVFHVRASYTDETQRLVSKLVNMQIKQLAIVYLDNAFGKEVLGDAQKALTANNIKAVAQAALATDGKNLAEVVAQVIAAKPSAVLLGTAGAASIGLIAGLKKASPSLPITGLSVTLTSAGIKQLGDAAQGLALTTVFPNSTSGKFAVVRDYQAAMRAAGQSEFTAAALETYINTIVMAEGLERAGRDVTRAKLRSALAGLRNLDIGGFNIDYQAAPYVGSRFVELSVLSQGGRAVS
jgi:branched-chain amino acid transport system substrate-binding protein